MKNKKNLVVALLMVGCIMTSCGVPGNESVSNSDEISPIIDQDGADPFVTTYHNQYLYTRTTGGDISIAMADSIQTLGAAELQCVYEPGTELQDLWAPEIWNLDGEWYIYFAATVPGETMHRMFVINNKSENPMEGQWELKPLAGMDDKFAIDGTIMELNGTRYFIWSGWETDKNVRQDIYLAEMVSPWEVKEEKVLLSMPELDWELNGEPLINEGPEVMIRNKTVNLVYSASGSWTDDYCLGVLTMEVGKNPKDPDNWHKSETPILSKSKDVYGPGHNSFTKTIDGREDLIIYHAARWQGAGWTRGIRFGYVEFDENGQILPMDAVSGDATLPIPSGEERVTRYNVSSFRLSDEVKKVDSIPEYVEGFESANDYISFDLKAEEEEDVCIVVFARVEDLMEGMATSLLISNGGQETTRPLCAGENYQPVFFPVHLSKGKNQIVISSDMGGTTVDIKQVEVRR